jgi:hypothetical protein
VDEAITPFIFKKFTMNPIATATTPANHKPSFFGKERRQSLFNGVKNVGGAANILSQTTTRRASITLLDREMKLRKQEFGLGLYDVMERNRSMGEKSGGEAAPEVVAVFTKCVSEIMNLLERRKQKQSDLLKTSQPKALCYQQQPTGESTCSEDSNENEAPQENTRTSKHSTTSTFKNAMQRGLQQATNSMQKTHSIAKLNTEIAYLDREIIQRKKQFGVDMYDSMAHLVDNYEAKDPKVGELFQAAKKDLAVPLSKAMKAEKEINDVRTSGTVILSRVEIKEFVNSNPSLWAMLQVNLGISEDRCKEVACRLVIDLASGTRGEEATEPEITKKEFKTFQKLYIEDPKGSLEFFHRSVFAAFDSDGNGVLDKEETDTFLDTFYVTGSIFQGDARLPEKEVLKKRILEELDENGDGLFDFDEIRSLISGSAARGDAIVK